MSKASNATHTMPEKQRINTSEKPPTQFASMCAHMKGGVGMEHVGGGGGYGNAPDYILRICVIFWGPPPFLPIVLPLIQLQAEQKALFGVLGAKVYEYDLDCTRVFFLCKLFVVGTWW